LISSVAAQQEYVVRREEPLRAPKQGRLAILCDIVEENWPSMDLVGDMLCKYLHSDHADSFEVTRLSPRMRRRLTKQSSEGGSQRSDLRAKLFNADRVLNRFYDYPRFVRGRMPEFDLFHVIDHSYGQLLYELPPERTVITCHDLDTFQCLLEPAQERRSVFFRKMMKRTLDGFRKAARVACDSVATRDELLAYDLVDRERVRVVPLGVHPTCRPEPDPAADAEARRLLAGGPVNAINLLHVGSTIKRKRIEVLLEVFAGVRKEFPAARLVRVGGPFTRAQNELIKRFKLEHAIIVLPHVSRELLAAIYRQSALVLQPSDREGFGLPVVEAMACGTPVVASDLPVLCEVGGNAAVYCPPGVLSSWTETVSQMLLERDRQPEQWRSRRRAAGIAQAANFSWAEYAGKMVDIYQELL
jgi:glycosyltransferase involved in cell wall biosynthesis